MQAQIVTIHHRNEAFRVPNRAPSTGPWHIYEMTDGIKTYIGKTSLGVKERLGGHVNFMENSKHTNEFLQEAFNNGSKFTIRVISTHAENFDARKAEHALIKSYNPDQLYNIRSARKEPSVRQEGNHHAELRFKTECAKKVHKLTTSGTGLMDACREVASKTDFSFFTIYSWTRGLPVWTGESIVKTQTTKKYKAGKITKRQKAEEVYAKLKAA